MNVNDIPVEETTQQKTEVDYLSVARQARSMQNWPSAEQNYNMLLQTDPQNIEAIFYSAYSGAQLSLFSRDMENRHQKFNVLVNNINLITEFHYSADEWREPLEMIGRDLIKLTRSDFLYKEQTRDDLGNSLQTERFDTKQMIIKMELTFLQLLYKIMEQEPQNYLFTMIQVHAEHLLSVDYAGQTYYHEILKNAAILNEQARVGTTLQDNAADYAHYTDVIARINVLKETYDSEMSDFKDLQNYSDEKASLKHSADRINNALTEMERLYEELKQFLTARNIQYHEFVVIPAKLKNSEKYASLSPSGWGLASLAVGLFNLLIVCFSFGLGSIPSFIGILLGIIGLFPKNRTRSYSVIGLILNIVMLLVNIGIFIAFIVLGIKTDVS